MAANGIDSRISTITSQGDIHTLTQPGSFAEQAAQESVCAEACIAIVINRNIQGHFRRVLGRGTDNEASLQHATQRCPCKPTLVLEALSSARLLTLLLR